MKRLLVIIIGSIVGFTVVATVAFAKAPRSSQIVIRHQVRGCHAWSVNGSAFRAAQTTSLARGGSITFVDDDVMPHKLVQTAGPAARFHGNRAMSRMGASVTVTFAKAGVYRFTTKPGEDYKGMANMKTIGEDNVLRLTVTVA